MEIAAEAWVLSCHKDGTNTVINGEHKGKTIKEVLDEYLRRRYLCFISCY